MLGPGLSATRESMTDRPQSEVEFSPIVREHWSSQGYCVHGEVSIYGRARFVDHVAHTGPCEDPDHVVAIEMKKGTSKSLRRQAWKLDLAHVADEIWACVISTPRESTIEKWSAWLEGRYHGWSVPGLMFWTPEGLEVAKPFKRIDDKYLKRDLDRLLLVDRNRGINAGWTSGADYDYVTHWKLGVEYFEEWARGRGRFTTSDVSEHIPDFMQNYSKPRQTANKMLRHLDEEGRLHKIGRKGRSVEYVHAEEES